MRRKSLVFGIGPSSKLFIILKQLIDSIHSSKVLEASVDFAKVSGWISPSFGKASPFCKSSRVTKKTGPRVNNIMAGAVAMSQKRTETLQAALHKMENTTKTAIRCSNQLSSRAGRLGSLTGPASDASSMLSHANANLAATLILMRDAREKFDTVSDCEPAIERLHKGSLSMEDRTLRAKGEKSNTALSQRVNLTEQDVYAAGDSIEILRDAYRYFVQRTIWRAAPNTLSNLERLYKMGEDSMCLLVSLHLKAAGQGAKPARNKPSVSPAVETAEQVRNSMI